MTFLSPDTITIQPYHKGFPPSVVGQASTSLPGRMNLVSGDFLSPVLLLDASALQHNIRQMQQFCDDSGIFLSPHVKTTMSPEIIEMQLTQGAWAVTVATPTQVMALRQLGANRVILANELTDPRAINWLRREMAHDPSFTCYCYVDSPEGVSLLENDPHGHGEGGQLPVLIEVGFQGGRGGVRNLGDATRIGELIAESKGLKLAGVAGYEGIVGTGHDRDRLDEVRAYLRHLRTAADQLLSQQDDTATDFIVTAGGSAFYQLVSEELDGTWRGSRPIRVVLRAGCYVTHDSGAYERYRHLTAPVSGPVDLLPSLTLWARVLSRPERDTAILDFGKRDTTFEASPPVVLHRLRRDDSTIEPAPPAQVIALNDQHAYLKGTTEGSSNDLDLNIGDLVGVGISHPCTTLDKWRLIPMVDASHMVVGTVQTLF